LETALNAFILKASSKIRAKRTNALVQCNKNRGMQQTVPATQRDGRQQTGTSYYRRECCQPNEFHIHSCEKLKHHFLEVSFQNERKGCFGAGVALVAARRLYLMILRFVEFF